MDIRYYQKFHRFMSMPFLENIEPPLDSEPFTSLPGLMKQDANKNKIFLAGAHPGVGHIGLKWVDINKFLTNAM